MMALPRIRLTMAAAFLCASVVQIDAFVLRRNRFHRLSQTQPSADLGSCAASSSVRPAARDGVNWRLHSSSSSKNNDGNDDSDQLLQALRARQMELGQEQLVQEQRWRNADCASAIRVALPDWVRRIDVDYPLVACGTSKGHVYISNLETGALIATNSDGKSGFGFEEMEKGADGISDGLADDGSDDEREAQAIVNELEKQLEEQDDDGDDDDDEYYEVDTLVTNDDDDDNDDDELDDDESPTQILQSEVDRVAHLMFGMYDGGGTLDIAFAGDLVCIANRQGSVEVWRIDRSVPGKTKPLVSQGTISALNGVIVTRAHLDEEYLWVATATGSVQAFALDGVGDGDDDSNTDGNDNAGMTSNIGTDADTNTNTNANTPTTSMGSILPLVMRYKPDMEWNLSAGTILSMYLHPDLGCGVVAMEDGRVEVISLEESGKRLGSFMPPFDSSSRRSSNAFVTSAVIASYKQSTADDIPINTDDNVMVDDASQGTRLSTSFDADGADDNVPVSYAVICGGNDGSLWMQNLRIDEDGEVDEYDPFEDMMEPLRPPHLGAVKCMVSPREGLLVSGALDGSIRVTDIASAKSLYQFVGFKAWLGSMWTDGRRLVSDGCDNTVMLHDFASEGDSDA